jgi:hypothetical protein
VSKPITTDLAPHEPGANDYTDEEIERGLVAVALFSGSSRRAARALTQQGLKIPRETLRSWAETVHTDRYMKLRREMLPELKARLAEQHEDLARRQMEVASRLTDRLEREAGELPIRDVSTAQRNLDVGSGIHTQRAGELRRPLHHRQA